MSIIPTARALLISISRQEMVLQQAGQLERRYPISTSKNPPSCQAESFGTPTGLHCIADCIGDGAPAGMVFKGRRPTGKLFCEHSAAEQAGNLITSRILRLRGLEPGHNAGAHCDSYDRYIYLHGTNHEDRIGQPFSGGCVELHNADVIELFNSVAEEDLVWIGQ